MKKQYIDTGKVRFIFREFPLDPLAAAASMLARCAGKDKYFPLIETLFQQQKDWVVQKPIQPLFAIAKQAGFTQQSFDACLADQKMLNGIEEVRTRAANKFNVNSTPTFFINGKIFRGALTTGRTRQADRPLSQGLIKGFLTIFSLGGVGRGFWAARPPRRPITRDGTTSSSCCGIAPGDSFSGRCGVRPSPARPTQWARALRDFVRARPPVLEQRRYETHAAAPARISSPSSSRPIS